MRTKLTRPDDLTARARLRDAALALFAAHGVTGTSVRDIAKAAGVSPGLVTHHFGSKEGLRQEVDDAMATVFSEALVDIPEGTPQEMMVWVNDAFANAMESWPEMRAYLRRSLLEDSEASRALFNRFLDLTRQIMRRYKSAGILRDDVDSLWTPYQILFLHFGPLLMAPLIQPKIKKPLYSHSVIKRRSRANLDLLVRGIVSDQYR